MHTATTCSENQNLKSVFMLSPSISCTLMASWTPSRGVQLAMQSAFTSISKKWVFSKSSGNVIGSFNYNKSTGEMSSLLDNLWSAVSGVIAKWKSLGIIETQPQRDHVKLQSEVTCYTADLITAKLQTPSSINISTQKLCAGVSKNGFPLWSSSCRCNV